MLQFYKPISHEIFALHKICECLVCEVWSKADTQECKSHMSKELEELYNEYGWLKSEIDSIYKLFKQLNQGNKQLVVEAFRRNNDIEELCNGLTKPFAITSLPKIVEQRLKPLFVRFYSDLLDKSKVPGKKKDYYDKLIEKNKFQNCPCCGLTPFEQIGSKRREAFDHYLPKADYPFSSVNFNNLVPLCYKCNSDRKKSKDPIKNGRTAFYPFSSESNYIGIELKIKSDKYLEELNASDLDLSFTGHKQNIETWIDVFEIDEQYKTKIASRFKDVVKRIKDRKRWLQDEGVDKPIKAIIHKMIVEYEKDRYTDMRFLKVAILKEILNMPALLQSLEKG